MSSERFVAAVSNPASVEPITRIGCALARANNGSLILTSVTNVPEQIPTTDNHPLASQSEAVIERALSMADSLGVSADGRIPPSHKPSRSIVSLVENIDATGLILGANEHVPFEQSLLGRTFLERVINQAPCDVFVEQIGPVSALPGDSVLVPIAGGTHADTVTDVAVDIGRAYDMDIHPVTVVSPDTDVHQIGQIEQRLRTRFSDDIAATREPLVIPSEDVVGTLVELTGDHDATVMGATAESTATKLMSGTVPAGLAKRTQNTLLLVDSTP